jgi:hypothetical protein
VAFVGAVHAVQLVPHAAIVSLRTHIMLPMGQ